jgi:hypothetical protein
VLDRKPRIEKNFTASEASLGGELDAQMEHQTASDTTKGGSKPLGSRGAMMADHVGVAFTQVSFA